MKKQICQGGREALRSVGEGLTGIAGRNLQRRDVLQGNSPSRHGGHCVNLAGRSERRIQAPNGSEGQGKWGSYVCDRTQKEKNRKRTRWGKALMQKSEIREVDSSMKTDVFKNGHFT